ALRLRAARGEKVISGKWPVAGGQRPRGRPARGGAIALVRSALLLNLCAILLVSPGARADDPPPKALIICGVPASMPRTDRTPDGRRRGLDAAVAERVGGVLGRPVEFHWCASVDCSWHCLPERRCDVVAGQPIDSGPPRGVAWSVPYAGARFGLVVPKER